MLRPDRPGQGQGGLKDGPASCSANAGAGLGGLGPRIDAVSDRESAEDAGGDVGEEGVGLRASTEANGGDQGTALSPGRLDDAQGVADTPLPVAVEHREADQQLRVDRAGIEPFNEIAASIPTANVGPPWRSWLRRSAPRR